MSNYCRNCGKKLKSNETECSCGAKVIEKRIDIEKKKEEIRIFQEKEKKYLTVIISLVVAEIAVLFLGERVDFFSSSTIPSLLALAIFIAIITARVGCGESKIIRGIFTVMIAYIAFNILFSILVIITCLGWSRYGCP